jgi:hypothetical protein
MGETLEEWVFREKGSPDDVIVGKLKNWPNRRRDNIERTLFSDRTCHPSHEHTEQGRWSVGSDSRWPPPDSRR